jgi:Tol biopolymer transport system component
MREYAIWVMDADGTANARLTFSGFYSKPVYSPDGSRVAMSASTREVRTAALHAA